jgi:hypothetical protein
MKSSMKSNIDINNPDAITAFTFRGPSEVSLPSRFSTQPGRSLHPGWYDKMDIDTTRPQSAVESFRESEPPLWLRLARFFHISGIFQYSFLTPKDAERGMAVSNAKLTSPPQDSKDSEPPRFGGSG